MRLTTMSDYAMRVLMYVAHQPQRLCTIGEIAAAFAISEAHLMKVTHRLGQEGFLETVRGKGGGMRLALEPGQIRLGDVLRRIEPDFALVECLGADDACAISGRCRLTAIVRQAGEDFLARFDAHTLADLLPDAAAGGARGSPRPLLRLRPAAAPKAAHQRAPRG